MADTYFDYALSQCRMPSISAICSVDSTQKELREKAIMDAVILQLTGDCSRWFQSAYRIRISLM